MLTKISITVQIDYTYIITSYLIKKRWIKLYKTSIIRSEALELTKQTFAEMKVTEICAFHQNVIS